MCVHFPCTCIGSRSRVEPHAPLQLQRWIPATSTKLTMKQKTDGDVVYLSMGSPAGREVFLQPQLTMPQAKAARKCTDKTVKTKTDDDMFVSYFWAVQLPKDGQEANMKVVYEAVKIANMEVNVPVMTSAVEINEGDHLLVEPYNKRHKRG